MAKAKARRRSGGFSIARRSSASVVVVQKPPRRRRAAAVVRRVAGAARRAGRAGLTAAKQRDLEIAATLGAVALGVAEQVNDDGEQRLKLPTFGGVDPALLYGGAAVLLPSLAPRMFGGKMMKRASFAGLGVWCAGVARSISRGSYKVSGEDDE